MRKKKCASDLPPPKNSESQLHLSKERFIFINQDFSLEMASVTAALLLHYDNQNNEQEITIAINSNGGATAALTNIYDVMQMIAAPIRTLCISKAYSAGAVLLAAGTPGKRYIYPNAKVMIHGLQFSFPLPSRNYEHSHNYYKFLESHNDDIIKILSKHTQQDFNKVKEDCKKDLYLDAKTALQYGIVDHILSSK